MKDLARPFTISAPAITKDLKVLERAGLIARSRDAQLGLRRLEAAPLKDIAEWVEPFRSFWAQSFDRLDDYPLQLQTKETKKACSQNASLAPRPDDWPVLLSKLGDIFKKDYDPAKDVSAVTAPSLIFLGDADAVRPAHAVESFELLSCGKRDGGWDGSGISNARVLILPCRELREHADSLPPMDACVPQSTEARLLLAEGERPFAHTRAPNG